MATRKEDRYPSATELAGELKRFQEGQLVLAHHYAAAEHMRRWLRRHWRFVAVATAFVRSEVDCAVEFANAANAAQQLGDWGLARGRLAPSLTVLRKSVERDPDNQFWRMDLALATSWACDNELASGRLDDALGVCLESAAEFEPLVRKDPEDWIPALGLAELEHSLTDVQRERRELAAARAAAAEELELGATWAGRKPQDQLWARTLSTAWWDLAAVARAAGSKAAARDDARIALAIADGLGGGRPDPNVELAAARAQTTLAELAAEDGDDLSAATGFRLAEERLARAARRWPLVVEIRERLALALIGWAEIDDRRDRAEARARGQRALSLLAPLERRGAIAYEFRDLVARARSAAGPTR